MPRSPAVGDEWTPRWRIPAVIGLTIFVAGFAGSIAIAMTSGDIGAAEPIFGPCLSFFTLAAIVLAWRAATHPKLDARTRSAWKWIGSSYLLLAIVVVLFHSFPGAAFPRPGDLAKLAAMPVLLVGLTRLPIRHLSRHDRLRLCLDAGTLAAAASLFVWYLLIAPLLANEHTTPGRIVAAAAYLLEDVGVIFVVAVVFMRGVNESVRRSMLLLVAAAFWWILTDALISHRLLALGSQAAVGAEIFCVSLTHFLLCAATFEQVRVASVGATTGRNTTRVAPVSKLPYAAVAAAFVVLLVAAAQPQYRLPWLGLTICLALLTGCVVARQLMAQQENQRMAVTDGLTGLVNRVGLHDALGFALARGARSGETTAVLLADLDGFKAVNDTYGHEAGDQILVAFGRALHRSVLGSDVVGRLGGDEFAVVVSNVGNRGNANAIIARLHTELEQPILIGDVMLPIHSSVGVALCGPGEMTLDEVMHQADLNMYEIKRARKAQEAMASSPHAEPALPSG